MTDVTPSNADRIGLYGFAGFGIVAAVLTAIATVGRLIEVLLGTDIPVTLPMIDETASLPLGPDGAAVTTTVENATVIVPSVAPATMFALIAQPLLTGAAIIAGIALFVLFSLNIARGRAFSRANTRVLWWGTTVATIGLISQWLFGNMVVNGTYSALSDYTYEGARFEAGFELVGLVIMLAVLSSAFQIGHRLQRDTDGLV